MRQTRTDVVPDTSDGVPAPMAVLRTVMVILPGATGTLQTKRTIVGGSLILHSYE